MIFAGIAGLLPRSKHYRSKCPRKHSDESYNCHLEEFVSDEEGQLR